MLVLALVERDIPHLPLPVLLERELHPQKALLDNAAALWRIALELSKREEIHAIYG